MRVSLKNDFSEDSMLLYIIQSGIESTLPFSVNSIGKFIANEGYCIERSGRNDYLIIYTISGIGELLFRKNHCHLSENSIVIINCNKYHKYKTETNLSGKWEFYWMHITGKSIDVYLDLLFQNPYTPINITKHLTLTNQFEEIIDISRKTDPNLPFYLSNCISQIMTFLVNIKKSNKTKNIHHEEILQDAASYIKENYSLTITVEDIAKHVGISKFYFSRLFKQIMRVTPYDYLLSFRINEAKKILLTTDYTSSQISSMVGFNDESNFCRTFKKMTGMTPINYRDKN